MTQALIDSETSTIHWRCGRFARGSEAPKYFKYPKRDISQTGQLGFDIQKGEESGIYIWKILFFQNYFYMPSSGDGEPPSYGEEG